MGAHFVRKSNTPDGFMVAGRGLPAWAVGLAIMSAYTSSISYIATPGKAFDTNWHPLLFALVIPPIAWFACRFVVPFYRESGLISVYSFLESRLGLWARFYGSFSFLLYMVGRAAVILYLAAVLMRSFTPWPIEVLVLSLGVVTIIYTLLGGMEAVVWTDVLQSVIMIGGGLFCAVYLTHDLWADPEPLLQQAWRDQKFSLGSLDFSLQSRTVWVMLLYGITENLRNLIADQNYVQKYVAAPSADAAKRSIWISTAIYLPLTVLFLYLGTALFAFYQANPQDLDPLVTKGDQVLPYFIATELPVGLRGLLIAAILAAAMSTIDSALNCSATVSLLDFVQKLWPRKLGDKQSVLFLRLATVFWGSLGTAFALLMIHARSALDVWWQISGIFGGGILGLFLLALLSVRVSLAQGLSAITGSILVIAWGTFVRGAAWWQCEIDPILVGAMGTGALLSIAFLWTALNRRTRERVS